MTIPGGSAAFPVTGRAASITPKFLLVEYKACSKFVPTDPPKISVVLDTPIPSPISLFVTAYGLTTVQDDANRTKTPSINAFVFLKFTFCMVFIFRDDMD